MPEKRRVRLQKSARRALDAAREAARRARSSEAPAAGGIADFSRPSTPPVERFAPLADVAALRDAAPAARPPTPPRPRRGEARLGLGAPSRSSATNVPLTSDEAALIELIDRLAVIAGGGNLAEVELAAGGTRVVVRSRAAAASSQVVVAAPAATPVVNTASEAGRAAPIASIAPSPGASPAAAQGAALTVGTFVAAPLTGIFYAAPSPGAAPLIAVGQVIAVGQPIGLIEAMKLFNEIKSDKAGRVVRIVAENGRLVKAKSPILEVEPV